MKIIVKIISHSEQRYDTCGDWWWEDDTLQIRVSALGDERMEYLVAAHEQDEAMGCRGDEIAEGDITDFDEDYERARRKRIAAPCGCVPTGTSEPGDDKHAPYRKWHQFATAIEKKRAKALGVNWQKYEAKINSL